MRHSRSHFMLAAMVASLSFATLAEAQGGVRPRPRDPVAGAAGAPRGAMRPGAERSGPEGSRRGPAARRGNAAAMLLALRGPLALTDDQVNRLQAMASANAPSRNASDMLRARADLMDAMQGDGNLKSARVALDRMSTLRNDRMIAGLKQRQDARAVLTVEQKSTLDSIRQRSRGRDSQSKAGRGRGALSRRG